MPGKSGRGKAKIRQDPEGGSGSCRIEGCGGKLREKTEALPGHRGDGAGARRGTGKRVRSSGPPLKGAGG